MYEPYVPPGGPTDEPVCACTAQGVPCPADCERCPADCPARVAGAPYQPYDEPAPVVSSSSSSSSSWSTPRRRRRSFSGGSSGGRRSSSTRSSGSSGGSSRRSTGKKAGAGLGAAATAAAGGIGALSSGGEDPGASDPEPYSTHSDPYAPYDDLQTVEDRTSAPIVSFRAQQGGRLVVVTGTWPDSDLPAGCRVEVTAVEHADRVVLEASAPVTRWQLQQGRACDPPAEWSTGTSYVQLDEPLGSRRVVTAGPLLRRGEEVDPAGAARVPRR